MYILSLPPNCPPTNIVRLVWKCSARLDNTPSSGRIRLRERDQTHLIIWSGSPFGLWQELLLEAHNFKEVFWWTNENEYSYRNGTHDSLNYYDGTNYGNSSPLNKIRWKTPNVLELEYLQTGFSWAICYVPQQQGKHDHKVHLKFCSLNVQKYEPRKPSRWSLTKRKLTYACMRYEGHDIHSKSGQNIYIDVAMCSPGKHNLSNRLQEMHICGWFDIKSDGLLSYFTTVTLFSKPSIKAGFPTNYHRNHLPGPRFWC